MNTNIKQYIYIYIYIYIYDIQLSEIYNMYYWITCHCQGVGEDAVVYYLKYTL